MPDAPIWIGFLIAAAIGLGLGMINAFFIARFRLPTLIVTLGTLSMFHGFLLFAIGNQIIRDVPPAMDAFARSALVRIPLDRGVANLHPAILITAGVDHRGLAVAALHDAGPRHLCVGRRA
jgi:simple sugar transport system permease protein